MTVILRTLPKGRKIGMAFSGGLDTSAALCWMRKHGAIPFAYVADLGQCSEEHLSAIVRKALQYGAEEVKLVDCKPTIARLGIEAIQCGAFHVSTAGTYYFNTASISRIVIGSLFSALMKERLVPVWSDGSTFKGNDIERFCKYSLLLNNSLHVYKPWLDDKFVRELGGRREMYNFLSLNGFEWPTTETRSYSIDANLLGITYEAKMIERLDFGLQDISCATTPIVFQPHAGYLKRITISFFEGRPVSLNGTETSYVDLFTTLNAVGSHYKVGRSDQIEDRTIGIKSRGIYDAPAMFILFTMFERLLTGIHDEQTIRQFREQGRLLSNLLYSGDWFSPLAFMLRAALRAWICKLISGEVTLELRGGNDYVLLDTYSKHLAYKAKQLSMEKVSSGFSSSDRVGQLNLLHCRTLQNRQKISKYKKLGLLAFGANGIPTVN